MPKVQLEKIFGICLIIMSVFMFAKKYGGLGLYIYSRRGTDYKSM